MDAETSSSPQLLAKREGEVEAGSEHEQDAKRAKLDDEATLSTKTEGTQTDASKSTNSLRNQPEKGKKVRRDNRGKEWVGRRRGTRSERSEGDQASEIAGAGEGNEEKAPRLPKRQCALLIGFCGAGYRGMQVQPNLPTIEGSLFQALVAAGAVSKDNADDPVKVGLQRAARTDAGVHAAGNVVSMKMITHVPGVPDLVKRVNEELPPEIRFWSFQRVQNSFNARMSCDSRKYTYFFPSYLLIPPKPTSAFYQSFVKQSSANSEANVQVDPFWQNVDLELTREEDFVRKKHWRVNKEKMEALREAVKRFEGTHNFHNFTVGRDVKDKSCMRHMKKIEVADPSVYGDTEWISILLHGQSFMLHQRKMMTVLVMSVRTGTPSSIINSLYGKMTVAVPKMPSLGLLLENPIFESYSKRVESVNEQKEFGPDHADYRAGINFDKHADDMQKFKEEFIYNRMREAEEKLQVFDRWQNIFDRYGGHDLLYFNVQGSIPDEAIVRKGERRPNPFRERKRFDTTDFTSDVPASAFAEDEGEEQEEAEEETMGKKQLEEAEG